MSGFLTETCLLTHGLKSISNETLTEAWPVRDECIVWVENGKVITGNIERYLSFRSQGHPLRVNMNSLDKAIKDSLTGALSASGTMAVCEKEGIPLAVSCGISGLLSAEDENPPLDLIALKNLNAALLCTSFKDMYDLPATLKWLSENNIKTAGYKIRHCSGYVFNSQNADLPASFSDSCGFSAFKLILNPIPPENKLKDLSILVSAINAGEHAFSSGAAFHPAVNAALDEATCGLSSRLQLEALIQNIKAAKTLIENSK